MKRSDGISKPGMRGVVTVTAVQTIPQGTHLRDSLILVAFTVAIVTLVVQGLLLPPVVRRLRPVADAAPGGERLEVLELRKRMKDAGDAAIAAAVVSGKAPGIPILPEVLSEVNTQEETWIGRLELWSTADLTDPGNAVVQFQQLRQVQLDAERAALRDAYERGAFSSETIDVLRGALDSEEISLNAVDGSNRAHEALSATLLVCSENPRDCLVVV